MARAALSLLGAVRRAVREHRLTDLFAFTLEAHPAFANRLLTATGLPEAEEVETDVEVRTRRGRPVDLEVIALDAHGGRIARLWSENKTGADYQPDQLPDYASDLPDTPSARQLITIVNDLAEVPEDADSPDSPRWRAFTWRDIAVMAWEAGRAAVPLERRPEWREEAMKRSAPLSERILAELLNYLEEEHGVVLEPLGHAHVAAFAYAVETGTIIEELLKRAGELMHADADGEPDWSEDGDAAYQLFAAEATWAEALEGYPELQAADTDRWSADRLGEPAFGVGYTLPGALRDKLLSSDARQWRDAVEAEGFSVADDNGLMRVWKTKYLAELIPKGATHEVQARELAQWGDEALRVLAQHDPDVTLPPKPVRRRRKGEAAEAEDGGEAEAAA
jgi:hypothetical protein